MGHGMDATGVMVRLSSPESAEIRETPWTVAAWFAPVARRTSPLDVL